MQMSFCQNCEKQTGHKRAVGAGTVLGAVVTGGFSLLATPFYPLRCIVCGSDETGGQQAGESQVPEYDLETPKWVVLTGVVLAAVAMVWVVARLGG